MKIMTWNIQDSGIINRNNPVTSNLQNILDVIESESPDIIVVQEFKYESYNSFVENGLKKLGYPFFQYDKQLEKYELRYGVLIASKFNCVSLEKPQNMLEYSWRNWVEISVPEYDLMILGIDVPLAETRDKYNNLRDNRREKKMFLKELTEKFKEYKKSEKPSLVLGDFNLHEEAVFKEYLPCFSYYLTEITTDEVTCRNHKFDYIFGNGKIVDKLQERHPPVKTQYSDHAYLFIEVDLCFA